MIEERSPGVVFWDFDGTLAARDGLWRGALVHALDLVAPDHGVSRDMVRPGLEDGFPWHRVEVAHLDLDSGDAWWQALMPMLTAAYERAGVAPVPARAAARLIPSVYTDPCHWTVFEDTVPALTRLDAAGYRNIVLSNHVPELAQLVAALGLARLFDGVLTSALTGYEKPNPAMFRLALEVAGNPADAWMVGDNPTADVAGARAAGMKGLLVRTSDGSAPARDLDWAVEQILRDPTGVRPG